MSKIKIIPKHMYETYAPGTYKTGYYVCPKCTKERKNTFWCFDCNCAMVRMPPKMPGLELNIHDVLATHTQPKIVREIVC